MNSTDSNEEGVALFMAGRVEQSLVKFREALSLSPLNPLFVYNVARVLDELKNPAAEDLYLISNSLGYTAAAFQLGIWYQERGDEAGALHFFREFVKKGASDDPDYPKAKEFIQRRVPTLVGKTA
jgi:tetratricopeptide (TPR) repeat protein